MIVSVAKGGFSGGFSTTCTNPNRFWLIGDIAAKYCAPKISATQKSATGISTGRQCVTVVDECPNPNGTSLITIPTSPAEAAESTPFVFDNTFDETFE